MILYLIISYFIVSYDITSYHIILCRVVYIKSDMLRICICIPGITHQAHKSIESNTGTLSYHIISYRFFSYLISCVDVEWTYSAATATCLYVSPPQPSTSWTGDAMLGDRAGGGGGGGRKGSLVLGSSEAAARCEGLGARLASLSTEVRVGGVYIAGLDVVSVVSIYDNIELSMYRTFYIECFDIW